ncbi:MAG TPA: flagellar basal body rod C-terminal domain-containing protein, partial [Clostridia bacterium]
EIGNIQLDNSITSSTGLNNIVASVGGKNGDNTIALQIADLRSQALIGKTGRTVSIDDFYRQIIQDVGSTGNEAANISDNQNKLVQSADNNRQAIMGVSMDEEMSNMMKYKFAYDAASRALNVIDQMIETVVTRMGLVGR